MGNYVIEVRKSVIVNPSQLGNYKIADSRPNTGEEPNRKISRPVAHQLAEPRRTSIVG
jgi:hypothetical protein